MKETGFMVKGVDLRHPNQDVNELQLLKDTQKLDLAGDLEDLKLNMALMGSKLKDVSISSNVGSL